MELLDRQHEQLVGGSHSRRHRVGIARLYSNASPVSFRNVAWKSNSRVRMLATCPAARRAPPVLPVRRRRPGRRRAARRRRGSRPPCARCVPACSASGESSATSFPRHTIPTRSQIFSTSSMSCVVRMTVAPVLHALAQDAVDDFRRVDVEVRGRLVEVEDLRLVQAARGRGAASCRMPSEYPRTGRSAASSSSTIFSTRGTRSRGTP